MKSRSTKLQRRSALAIGMVAAASIALTGCGAESPEEPAAAVDLRDGPPVAGTVKAGALEGVTLTFVSYGGIYQDGQMQAAGIPFGEESGATILSDGPSDQAKIQAQVTSGNVTWDVIDTTNVFAAANCGTLFQKLDTTLVDTSKIPAGLITDECSVPAMNYGLIIMYNAETYGDNPPTSWADYYDTEKFPGKRGMQAQSGELDAGVLEGALIADGVTADEMYPLDVDRALDKMSSIRDDLVFWTTGAQSQELLESGQVDMSVMWSGRAFTAVKNGAPFEPVWNEWMPEADVIAVPVGAKNADASFAWINYYLGAEQQAKLTELTSYSPINVDAKPVLDELGQKYLTTAPEKVETAFPLDFGWWAENRDETLAAYTSWLAG